MDRVQITHYWQTLPWNNIKHKANMFMPKFAFVLLIILITQTLAELTWSFFTPSEVVSLNTKANNQVAVVNKAMSGTNLESLSSYHLFGDAKKPTQFIQQKVIDAPETRLRLELKGVFSSTNASQGLAIISSSKGNDKTYLVGDKVTSGVLLHAVYEDRVILERNGQLETLRLPKLKLNNGALKRVPSTSTPTSARKNSTSSGSQNSSSQRLRKIRETLLKDPAKIWQDVRINPVMKNGHIHGYTMVHNDRKLMESLNIRESDVITGINGQSLDDPATLYGLMGSLSEQKSLEVSIERNGQQQTVHLSF